MTARTLAWRAMTADPARATLAVAGVAIIGALLFDMLLLSRGLLVSLRQMLDSAGYDVRIVASEGFPIRLPVDHASAVAADVARLPEVRAVAVVRTDRAILFGRGDPIEATLLTVSRGAEAQAWRLVDGENLPADAGSPDRPPPAVIDRALAEALGLRPGAPLWLRALLQGEASALPAVRFRLVGIAEFATAESGDHTVATTLDGYRRARTAGASDDAADVILAASRPEVGAARAAAAIERARPDVRAFSNDQVVARFNENGFAYFRQISVVLSSVTMGFAVLLVATLLTVSVNQRLGEVAALRALGLPRRRVAAMLAWESACVVGLGGALSIPLGWALAVRLDHILRQIPNLPERLHFFVFEPELAAWHAALLGLTAAAAAAYPVWIAARLPIAETLRQETIS